jgi:hypothetical protein
MSCGKESLDFHLVTRNNSIELKQETEELEGETIDIIENLDGLYTDVHYYNDLLYVLNQDDHYAVDVIDPSTGNVVLNIGSIGEGDYDFMSNGFLKIVDVDSVIQIYDFSTKSISLFESITGELVDKIYLSNEFNTAQSAFAIDSNEVLIVDLMSSEEFNRTFKGANIQSPKFHISSAVCPLSDLKPRDIVYMNKLDKIVTYNIAWNYINVYSGENQDPVRFEFGINENIEDDLYIGRNHLYYYDVDMVDSRVYALYIGVSSAKQLIMSNVGALKSELHAYDLKESRVVRYFLDRLVNACSFDSKNNLIYCIQEGNNDHPIVLFKA